MRPYWREHTALVRHQSEASVLLTQDGDDEGCLRLDHLPTPAEAEAIRDSLGIRKRRTVSPEASAKATAALESYRASLNAGFLA
jgi:hypothetical protein